MFWPEPMDQGSYDAWRGRASRSTVTTRSEPVTGARKIEAYARDHGCVGVMLHVFGDNTGARELYRSEGFAETNVIMLKRME